jgi:hypothetical protein
MVSAIGLWPALPQHPGKRARIAKSEVHSLSRKGVHIMSGVPHQRKARPREMRHALQLREIRGGRDELRAPSAPPLGSPRRQAPRR